MMLERGYRTSARHANWLYIQKLCAKRDFVISDTDIENIVNCETGNLVSTPLEAQPRHFWTTIRSFRRSWWTLETAIARMIPLSRRTPTRPYS
ncbi:hypothetical protein CSUI_004196 [Cystoisospora suis]|uniref:Uncharacterized protein n=1 Tax=Cystoisospora suis TaxID=483139 RepID=A0A2C6KNA3_9APIC|nr:hypothetical protein CSUI_004196 [Cystoisospora suis]